MFRLRFVETNIDYHLKFGEIQTIVESTGEYPIYNGLTTVRPSVEEQTLPTEKTVVMQDITVQKIPISDVSNASGGTTITIG